MFSNKRFCILNFRTSGNMDDSQCHDETESSDAGTSNLGSVPSTSSSGLSFPQPRPKKRKETFETQLITMLQKQNPTPVTDENDPEKMFLLSLLPKMKKLNASALFDFEIKCMQLLQSYLDNTQSLTNPIPPITRNPIPSTPSPQVSVNPSPSPEPNYVASEDESVLSFFDL